MENRIFQLMISNFVLKEKSQTYLDPDSAWPQYQLEDLSMHLPDLGLPAPLLRKTPEPDIIHEFNGTIWMFRRLLQGLHPENSTQF